MTNLAGFAPVEPGPSQKFIIDKAPVPARYSLPLPATVAGLKAWLRGTTEGPPISHVQDNLLGGNAQWFARLRTAANAVPEAERMEWARLWEATFEFDSAAPEFCGPARKVLAGPPSTLRAAISGPFAKSCVQSSDRALLLRSDTPYWAVLSYFSPMDLDGKQTKPEYDPRLADVARIVILAAQPKPAPKEPAVHTDSRGGVTLEIDPVTLFLTPREVAFTLTGLKDPRADEALLKIHSEINNQDTADNVALAFKWSGSARGKLLADAACKRRPQDPMCEREQAFDLSGAADDPKPTSVASIKSRMAQLSQMGFPKVDALEPETVGTDSAEVILLSAGYGWGFDVETGQYPNQHDSLMRALAHCMTPELDDAVFEEKPPGIEDETSPYELIAYSGGKRYRTLAKNLGDWYDVDAVLGLLNAVLADRGSDWRFMILPTTDQTAIVLGGPRWGLARAVSEKLIAVGMPGDAERIGKDFENQVLETLREHK